MGRKAKPQHPMGRPYEWQSETHRRLMLEWYGLVENDRSPARGLECPPAFCPSWVADRRCRANNTCDCPTVPCRLSAHEGQPYMPPRYRAKHRPKCICQTLVSTGLRYDHTYIWRSQDTKAKAWTTEPYNHPKVDEAQAAELLREYGLRLRVTDQSPWFPEYTMLFLITKA